MRPRNPFTHPPVDNDPLGTAQTTERSTWGLPSDEGDPQRGDRAELPPATFDYSGGVMVTRGTDADEQAPPAHPHLIRARVDAPHSYELPHEATHRRYESPLVVPIAQAAAGFTVIAPTVRGLHYVKVLAVNITLDAAGTIKFVQGSNDGTTTADLTGAMNMGGASAPPLNLAPSELANPWLYTSPDQALGIFTVTGKANGWALVAYSPYDN
jgi:hypothetical protein